MDPSEGGQRPTSHRAFRRKANGARREGGAQCALGEAKPTRSEKSNKQKSGSEFCDDCTEREPRLAQQGEAEVDSGAMTTMLCNVLLFGLGWFWG